MASEHFTSIKHLQGAESFTTCDAFIQLIKKYNFFYGISTTFSRDGHWTPFRSLSILDTLFL